MENKMALVNDAASDTLILSSYVGSQIAGLA